LRELAAALAQEGRARLERDEVAATERGYELSGDMRYAGQAYEIVVPFDTIEPSEEGLARPGSVVNAVSPAPVANCMAVGHRVVNAVMGAFAQALPGCVPASYYGVSYAYALNVRDAYGET